MIGSEQTNKQTNKHKLDNWHSLKLDYLAQCWYSERHIQELSISVAFVRAAGWFSPIKRSKISLTIQLSGTEHGSTLEGASQAGQVLGKY